MLKSEHLLSEIMLLLTRVNSGFNDIEERVGVLETKIDKIETRFDDFMNRAFPDSLTMNHYQDHVKLRRGFFKRMVLKLMGERV